jgi:hypothetical protein
MRVSLLTFILILNSVSCIGQEAVFFAEKYTHKFSKTDEGTKLEHSYTIWNKGTKPLVISAAKVDCSCTEVVLPTKPILPGEQSTILLKFDTNGKAFLQDRIIELTTNTKRQTERLRFKVYVLPKS